MRSPLVGIPGLEPGKAGPESAVLPLHHIPIGLRCKSTIFSGFPPTLSDFFYCRSDFFCSITRICSEIETHADKTCKAIAVASIGNMNFQRSHLAVISILESSAVEETALGQLSDFVRRQCELCVQRDIMEIVYLLLKMDMSSH